MDKYVIAPPSGSTNNSVGANDRPWKEGHFDSIKLNGGDLGEYLAESTGYGIVSGCTPTISGLTVSVAAGVVHLPDGTRKEISASTVTLDAADTTNPRIDLVYVTSAGVVAKITGTASASPSVPVMPVNGISVAQVSVAANATAGIVEPLLSMIIPASKCVFVCNNVEEMKASGNLVPGMEVVTKGYTTENDGNGAFYNIRSKDASDIDDNDKIIFVGNGNVAERIIPKSETYSLLLDNIDINKFPFMSVKQDTYNSSQGICVAGDYLIYSLWISDASALNRLIVVDIVNKQVLSHLDGEWGHMGCLTYNPNDSCVYLFTGATVKKFKLEGYTLTYVDTTPISIDGDYCFFAAYHDGFFYALAQTSKKLYKSTDLVNFTYLFDINFGCDITTVQGCTCDDNFFCLSCSGQDLVERIFVFDKVNGTRVKVYQYYRNESAEIEDIDIYGKFIFINTNRRAGAVYKVPLYKDYDGYKLDNVPFGSLAYISAPVLQQIYVDKSNEIAFPDGTSTNPLNQIEGALAIARTRQSGNRTIVISGNWTTLSIEGTSDTVNIHLASGCEIDVLKINACYLNILSIAESSNPAIIHFLDINNAVVTITGANVDLVYKSGVDTFSSRNSPINNYRSTITGQVNRIKNYSGALVYGRCGITNMHTIVSPENSPNLLSAIGTVNKNCMLNGEFA